MFFGLFFNRNSAIEILRLKTIIRIVFGPDHLYSAIAFPLDNPIGIFYNYLN
jgi:hypothetical protein